MQHSKSDGHSTCGIACALHHSDHSMTPTVVAIGLLIAGWAMALLAAQDEIARITSNASFSTALSTYCSRCCRWQPAVKRPRGPVVPQHACNLRPLEMLVSGCGMPLCNSAQCGLAKDAACCHLTTVCVQGQLEGKASQPWTLPLVVPSHASRIRPAVFQRHSS